MLNQKQSYLNMDSLEERVNKLETLLTTLVTDIRATRESISKGFEKIDTNFEQIHSKIDNLSGSTGDSFVKVDFTLQSIKEEIDKINTITGYETEINNLKIIRGGKKND